MNTLMQTLSAQGRVFLVLYDYTESGVTKRCGFLCSADNRREAAEFFWNQHPGEWFSLVSVSDGQLEAFWDARHETFITIPQD